MYLSESTSNYRDASLSLSVTSFYIKSVAFSSTDDNTIIALTSFFAVIITVVTYRSELPLLLGERKYNSTVDLILTESAASTWTLVSRAGILSNRP